MYGPLNVKKGVFVLTEFDPWVLLSRYLLFVLQLFFFFWRITLVVEWLSAFTSLLPRRLAYCLLRNFWAVSVPVFPLH